ncbi:unnamed protein product [Closterium sp. NIES-54]
MDVWGPACVRGKGHERYFLLVVDDYSSYTTVFPLRSKGEVTEVLINWIRGVCRQLSESFGSDLPVLRLHSDRGGEFSSDLLRAFCRTDGIRQTFTLPASPQQNGIAERRIGMVMDVARTSMIHAAAPHFLWPFAVQYAAHQINLQPCVSLPETTPTLRWTGKVGDASVFRVWGSRDFVCDASADKLSSRAGRVPSGVSQVDPVEVAVNSGPARGAKPAGAEPEGAEPGVAKSEGAELGGAEPERVEPWGAGPGGADSGGAEPWGAEPERAESGSSGPAAGGASGAGAAGGATGAAAVGGAFGAPGGAAGAGAAGAAGPGGAGAGGTGNVGGPAGVGAAGGAGAASPGGARTGGTRAAGAGGAAGVGAVGAGAVPTGGAAGAGAVGGTGAGGAVGVVAGDPGAEGTGAVSALSGGAAQPRPYYVQQPASPLPGPSPYSGSTRGLTKRREPESRPALPESRPASPVRAARTGRRVPRPRPPPVPGTHSMTLLSPTVMRVLATVVTDPSFESTAASSLVAELVNFAAHCRLDYAASLVSESESVFVCPPSVEGECVLGTDVLEDRQEEFEFFAAAVPHLVSMLLAPEGDPDAPDIPTPCSYAEAIEGPYSSQWQAAMDAEMASWNSTGTYADEVPPPRANILHRPPGFTGSFPAGTKWSLWRLVYGLRQAPREWHNTMRTTLAAIGFVPSTADVSLFLRTNATLPPFYALVYVDDLVFATADIEALAHVKSDLQKRHRCIDLGELTSYLGLRITRDRAQRTITLTQSHMVQQVLQRFGFTYSLPQSTPLPTCHSLSAPPLDKSVEPSGLYPELVGCLMYLMTCTRPDLAYPLSLLARYVAPGRHRKVHWDAVKRVLCYLCSTSGMGLVLGGRGPVVLTGHADASWVDDSATLRSSQGYTFSLGSGSVSWRSTRSSLVLSSSCEAEICAGAMAAQELRWLTYLLTDLGEQPRSPLVLYVDKKAMIALCQEHRLEHKTKHIALCYFLARELQQRGQLRLAYVTSQANTADVFTKALQPCDHQRFCTVLSLEPTVPHLLTFLTLLVLRSLYIYLHAYTC